MTAEISGLVEDLCLYSALLCFFLYLISTASFFKDTESTE